MLTGWEVLRERPGGRDDAIARAPVIWRDDTESLTLSSLPQASSGWLLAFADLAAFEIHPEFRRVVAHSACGVSPDTVDHFLFDQVWPRLLAHEGAFVLHASLVEVNGKALLFTGPSGRGKSTLAAYFDLAGDTLLGDDAAVVSIEGGVVRAKAVYPSLRLFPDSLAGLFGDAAPSREIAPYTSKRRVEMLPEERERRSLPVAGIFRIESGPESEAIAIKPIDGAESCINLIHESFELDPTDNAKMAAKLQMVGELINRARYFKIEYPRDYSLLPQVRSAILEKLTEIGSFSTESSAAEN